MKHFALAVALSALWMSAAQSADLPVRAYTKTPPLKPASTWTGFYAGANVGYGWQDPTVTFTPADQAAAIVANGNIQNLSSLNPLLSFDISRLAGGGQFGYNFQFDQHWLAGFEADFNGSGIKGHGLTPFVVSPTIFNTPGVLMASEKVEWFGTLRARLGYLATPRVLLFGTGGFAYGKVDHSAALNNYGHVLSAFAGGVSVFCNPGPNNCYAGSSSRTASGWTGGVGAEYAIWQNWAIKAEYLYVNLGRDSFAAHAVTFATAASHLNVSYTDTHFNLVRIGANYRF